MLDLLRSMPTGVRVLLVYGFGLLCLLALTLPLVVAEAIEAPISPLGLLWMLLLAYLIFTLTVILQRKQAAWTLSIGLASLSLPLVLVLFFWAGVPGAAAGVGLCVLLFLSLRSPAARRWFAEP
jgi:hypothetical protein